VSLAGDLTDLAAQLKIQLNLFQDNPAFKLDVENYLAPTIRLDRDRKKFAADPLLKKHPSVKETVTHLTKAMVQLSGLMKGLAELRGAYTAPLVPGDIAAARSAQAALGKAHDKMTDKLENLVTEVEEAAASVGRASGAANSGQGTNEERSYRVTFNRIEEGEYRRGLRRSG
jgi:hypothetical protein